jgi:hypothetical protein
MKKPTRSGPTDRAAVALAKAEARAQAQRDAEEESRRIREMFAKERAALARRYGPGSLG